MEERPSSEATCKPRRGRRKHWPGSNWTFSERCCSVSDLRLIPKCPSRWVFLLFIMLSNVSTSAALRCYTDVEATKGLSVECGMNTGCVKIYIDTEEMLMRQAMNYGYSPAVGKYPDLPKKFQSNPVVMRGCFVLAVPDRCYNAKNGLSYCWCSTKDLCNGAEKAGLTFRPSVVLLVSLWMAARGQQRLMLWYWRA